MHPRTNQANTGPHPCTDDSVRTASLPQQKPIIAKDDKVADNANEHQPMTQINSSHYSSHKFLSSDNIIKIQQAVG